jgi:hypothetical protein
MNFTHKDFEETSKLANNLSRIDNIDSNYVNAVSDEIFNKQPFFLSVLLGYRFDTSLPELEEIMKIYFLIWEYFKDNKRIQAIKLTENHFEKIQQRNIKMLNYAAGEPCSVNVMEIYSTDLQNFQSKALFTTVLFRFNTRAVLLSMDKRKRGIIILGMKSFIECFETI